MIARVVTVTVPDDLLLAFKDGFPWNWEELLQVAAEELVTHHWLIVFVLIFAAVMVQLVW